MTHPQGGGGVGDAAPYIHNIYIYTVHQMAAWSQAKSRTCDFSSGPGVKFSSGRIYISATFADSWWHFYIPPKLAADFLHREVPGIYIYYTYMYIHTQSPYISSSSGPILPFFSPVHDEQKGSRSLRVGVDLSEADPCATYLPLLGEARVGLGGGSDFGRFWHQHVFLLAERI